MMNIKKQNGAILIAVMGLIFLMTLIVTLILTTLTDEFNRLSLRYDREQMEMQTHSALEGILGVVAQAYLADGRLTGPGQWCSKPLKFYKPTLASDTKLEVTVIDESGKLALTEKTPDVILQALFEKLGFAPAQCSTLTDCLLDWIDPSDAARLSGAERDYYEHLPIPYRPANGPLKGWEELRYIKEFDTLFFEENGDPKPVVEQFKQCVSIISTSKINLNTACDTMLQLFCENINLDYAATLRLLEGPDGVRGTADDGYLLPFKPQQSATQTKNSWEDQVGNTIRTLTIDIKLTRLDIPYMLSTSVVIPQTGGSKTKVAALPKNFFTLVAQGEGT